MDKVFIEALEIECVIGIYDWERKIRQPVVFDIEMAFDNTRGIESIAMSFIVNRPANEEGFTLDRQEIQGRSIRYTVRGYGANRPEGQRY